MGDAADAIAPEIYISAWREVINVDGKHHMRLHSDNPTAVVISELGYGRLSTCKLYPRLDVAIDCLFSGTVTQKNYKF